MRRNSLSLALAALVLLAAAACHDSVGPEHRQPAKLEIVYGQGQTGTAGAQLGTLVAVRVVDRLGRPVAGQPVSFVVAAGGGAVSPATDVTNRHGVAQTWWTMGTVAGTAQAVEARIAGSATLTATFNATVTGAAPAQMVRFPTDDSSFVGSLGAPLDDSLAVQVRDRFGNGLPGVEVAWTAAAGGGSLPPNTTTDANGVARAQWTLGSDDVPAQVALASATGLGELRFVAPVATTLSWPCDCPFAKDAGSRVRLAVRVKNGWGGLQRAMVRWTASGGGTVTPASSATDSDGMAWVDWTLGPALGPQTLTASLAGLRVTRTDTVLPRLTQLAEVPGEVLDATADRVLWVDTAGGGWVVKVRTVTTAADVTVASMLAKVSGALFEGGALFWYLPGREIWNSFGGEIFEYRNGGVASVGRYFIESPPSVEGNWAAWANGPIGGPYTLFRRDLASGTTRELGGGRVPDVGPGGEVAFLRDLGRTSFGTPVLILLYRNEATELMFQTYTAYRVQTDGVNVVVDGFELVFSTLEWVQLTSDFYLRGELMAGGWIVIGGRYTPARRRSPAGVTEEFSASTCARQQALAPDGTLVCVYSRTDSVSRYNRVLPDGRAFDAGAWEPNDRVVRHGDRFLVIRGGSVYTLGAPPAAQLR